MAELHKKNRYTEEEEFLIKKHYPNLNILEKLLPNRGRKNIINKAGNMGLSSKIYNYTKYEDDIIRKYYPKNGAEYIVNNFLKDRTYKAIQGRAFQLGVKLLSYNESYFSNIDSEEKAYWIGFIMSDGYVGKTDNRFGIELQILDIGHLEKFLKCINSNQIIKRRKRTSGYCNGSESCNIALKNKKMHDDLVHNGVIPNKSLILDLPDCEYINKYFFSLLRGLIDGDGTIGLYTSSLGYTKPHIMLTSGSENLLLTIQRKLSNYGINVSITKTTSDQYRLMTEKQETVKVLLNLMYKDSSDISRLSRKYEKAKQIANYYNYSLV